MTQTNVYRTKHKLRFVTASSLFDGHDASINVMRRILQASGAEVIHLGHNRSVDEVVTAAIQEDVQGIAVSSYQGGHMEYFKYMYDLLQEKGAGHIKIFGGGGGVIVPPEIKELHAYGIAKIFSPEDGRQLGLQGMINVMLEQADYSTLQYADFKLESLNVHNPQQVAQWITLAEEAIEEKQESNAEIRAALQTVREKVQCQSRRAPILGITGTAEPEKVP